MRARDIKPGFFKNDQLADCSMAARLLFPGIWMLADREGRLENRPRKIKGEIFPFDAVDVPALLEELENAGLIRFYEVNGASLIWIPCFKKHQSPHKNEKGSELPAHPDELMSTCECQNPDKHPSTPVISGGVPDKHPSTPVISGGVPDKHPSTPVISGQIPLTPSSLTPSSLLPEGKEECVFNAGVRVKASSVPEKALEQAPEPVAEEPKASSPRQPSVAFDQFLDAYPVAHRGGRAEAERVWVGLEHNHSLPGLNRLLDALGEWEASERWKAKGGQYIPTAANFLAREYWLQKPPTPETNVQQRDGPRTQPQQFKTAKMAESEGRGRFAGTVLAMMNARELEEQEKKNGIISRHCGGIGQDLCALSATGTGQHGI